MTRPPELDFRAVDEREAGPKWQALFREFWPLYEKWFLREGDAARPTYAASRRALREAMPELVPTYERLCELAGGGDRAARFLSLYRPPPFMTGCSQAIWTRDGLALVRNYDYLPRLCDGVILRSGWTRPTVVAAVDCLWGVLDGMNEHGLAAALAFGGRKVVGDGFAITLVLRYVLETCTTVPEARRALVRIRPHMAYNVSLLDAQGRHVQAMLSPDRPPVFSPDPVCTNHQRAIEWPAYARASRTLEREAWLRERIADPAETLDGLVARFLEPPLHRHDFARWGGTLYTAVYRPDRGTVEMVWPGHRWRASAGAFREETYVARYAAAI